MSFTLSQLFPGIETGINRIGFLFGAGSSKEAGYPLLSDLTKTVIAGLCPVSRATLDELLAANSICYDDSLGIPNIEALSDLVEENYVTTQLSKFKDLELEIRKHIIDVVLSINSPDLSHHVRFFDALKRRANGAFSTVTILTTNYDILFELAAAEAGVRIETGFEGPIRRTFEPAIFDLVRGTIDKTRFSHRTELRVDLIKLHGSISWIKDKGRIFETGLDLPNDTLERAMILPRRKKVMDTLSDPYDQLFTRSSRILGTKCKYIVSCGFSYGDKHINDQLIFPKLQTGKIRLTALCGEEPDCIDELKKCPPFHAGFPSKSFMDQKDISTGTDLWKFSELVKLLVP